MKKTFTLFLGLALCSSINAQTIKFLTLGIGIPGFDEPQLMGQGISPDGKYVCGSIEMGSGYFIADLIFFYVFCGGALYHSASSIPKTERMGKAEASTKRIPYSTSKIEKSAHD